MRPRHLPLILMALLGCSAASTRVARAPTPGTPHLKVMTYNVNYGLAWDRATLQAMRAGDPDVICLQETSPAWEQAIQGFFGDLYPHRKFIHAPAAGGSAVLSRHPIKRHRRVPPRSGWFAASVSVIDAPIGEVQILNVHLRPAISDSGSVVVGYFSTDGIRLAEIKGFLEFIDADEPFIALGDFNEEPDGDALEHLSERLQMQNLLPQYAPEATTWRWRAYGMNFTGTLDHILISPHLEALSTRVFKAGRSDHLPVVATLARKPKGG